MDFSLGGLASGINALSINVAVRLTLVGGRLAATSPLLSGMVGFMASVFMPLEMQLAAGQANVAQSLGGAGISVLFSSARQLTHLVIHAVNPDSNSV